MDSFSYQFSNFLKKFQKVQTLVEMIDTFDHNKIKMYTLKKLYKGKHTG